MLHFDAADAEMLPLRCRHELDIADAMIEATPPHATLRLILSCRRC